MGQAGSRFETFPVNYYCMYYPIYNIYAREYIYYIGIYHTIVFDQKSPKLETSQPHSPNDPQGIDFNVEYLIFACHSVSLSAPTPKSLALYATGRLQ